MKVWLVRILAIAFVGIGIGLAILLAGRHALPSFASRAPAKSAAELSATPQQAPGPVVSGASVGTTAAESVDELSAKLQQATKSAIPGDYVLAARERQLTTIDAAFTFVRDNIRFESYSGILRGADGTFHAHAGNAFDRAMLLAAILQSNKIPARLVTGQLPHAQAEQLFLRMFESAVAPLRPPQSGTLTARIFDRAHRDYSQIAGVLGNRLAAVSAPSHDDVVKEIEQHAWVQAQRDGQWIDLDPSFPDSTVGRAYAAMQQQFEGPPAMWMQRVTIRVIAETFEGGALDRTVSLETTMPAYQLVDRPVYLLHHVYRPFNGQGGDLQFIFGTKDVQEPVLIIAGHRTVGKPIDFGSGASAPGAAPPNAVQAAADAFGTSASAPASPNAKTFVAEWLEFEVAFPGGRNERTRRVLVDRAGTGWRNAANHDPSKLHDLARNTEGLIAPQTLYNIWLSAGRHDLLGFVASAQDLQSGVAAEDPKAPTFVETMWPFAMRDLAWFIASDHIVVPAINDTPGVRFYADSPRIFVWGVGPDPGGSSNGLVVTSDLRRDSLRGVAKDATLANVVAQHKLWFGVLEGALEHEMSAPPNTDSGASVVTTSSLTESGDLVALGSGSSVIAKDPETQARLQAALAGGDTLVVPKQVLGGGISGWWQVARYTGDVRAVLDETLNGTFGKRPIDRQAEYQPTRYKRPGQPGGSGTSRINNPDDPFYKRGYENPQLVCDQLAAGLESEEDRASSGRVCAESTPAWKTVAVISAEGAIIAVMAWEAWQLGSK